MQLIERLGYVCWVQNEVVGGVCAYVCLGECGQMAGAGMGFNRLRW